MFAPRRIARDNVEDLQRLEAMVRARYCLGDEALVLVSAEDSRVFGAPPLLTRILFWTGSGRRHRVTVFKPPVGVVADDLPPGWVRSALIDDAGGDCC